MPKGMDLKHAEGVTWYAIFSIDGDTLHICYADPNPEKQRPGGFATEPDSGLLLVDLKRHAH